VFTLIADGWLQVVGSLLVDENIYFMQACKLLFGAMEYKSRN